MTVKYKKIGLMAILLGVALMLKADGANQDQWASMEFKQWKFSPEGYYYSWVHKKFLGITFKLPGSGIHDRGTAGTRLPIPGDNYVNERWRQMSGLRAEAAGMALLEKQEREKIKDRWEEILKRDGLELADKAVDAAKLIEDDKRGKLCSQITKMVEDLPTGESLNIMDEYERIQQNIKIIHDAFIPNADKIVAYRKQMHKLERLNKITRMIYIMRESEKIIHPEREAITDDDWFDLEQLTINK